MRNMLYTDTSYQIYICVFQEKHTCINFLSERKRVVSAKVRRRAKDQRAIGRRDTMRTIGRVSACADLSIGLSKLHELIRSGHLDARKIGRRTVITTASIQKFVEELPRALAKAKSGQ